MVHDDLIGEMTKQIVGAARPRRVIVFGSHARSDAWPESDIDFLVEIDDESEDPRTRWDVMSELWNALASAPVSKDILVYRRHELERWRESRSHVIGRALRDGRVVYERE